MKITALIFFFFTDSKRSFKNMKSQVIPSLFGFYLCNCMRWNSARVWQTLPHQPSVNKRVSVFKDLITYPMGLARPNLTCSHWKGFEEIPETLSRYDQTVVHRRYWAKNEVIGELRHLFYFVPFFSSNFNKKSISVLFQKSQEVKKTWSFVNHNKNFIESVVLRLYTRKKTY